MSRHGIFWKPVSGSVSGAGSRSLESAGSLFSKAFDNFSGIAKTAQSDLEAQNNAQINAQLQGITNPEQLEQARAGLGLDALTQKYGKGNFDPNIATNTLAGLPDEFKTKARKDLLEGRADTAYGLGLEDQARARDENIRRLTEEAGTRETLAGAGSFARDFIQPISDTSLSNIDAIEGALVAFKSKYPELSNSISVDSTSGEISADASVTPAQLTEFTEMAQNSGRVAFQNRTEFDTLVSNYIRDKGITDPAVVEDVKGIFAQSRGKNVLSSTEQADLSGKVSSIQQTAERSIKRTQEARSQYAQTLDANTDSSPAGKQAAARAMNQYLADNFKDSHTNLLGVGDSEGGTELKTITNNYLTKGIIIDGKKAPVDAGLLIMAMNNIGDFEDSTLDNPSVSKSALKSELIDLIGAGFTNNSVEKRAAITEAFNKREDALLAKQTADISALRGAANLRAGVVNTQRNPIFDNAALARETNLNAQLGGQAQDRIAAVNPNIVDLSGPGSAPTVLQNAINAVIPSDSTSTKESDALSEVASIKAKISKTRPGVRGARLLPGYRKELKAALVEAYKSTSKGKKQFADSKSKFGRSIYEGGLAKYIEENS